MCLQYFFLHSFFFFQRKTLDDAYPRLFLTGVPLSPRTATAEFENQISVNAAAGV